LIETSASIHIERPTDEVFGFLSDLGNAARWQGDGMRTELLTEGPLGVGTRFREDFRFGGLSVGAVCELTEVAAGRRFAYRSTSGRIMRFEGSFGFEPESGGTKLTYAARTWLRGPLRWLEPFMRGEAQREARTELERVKRVVESDAA